MTTSKSSHDSLVLLVLGISRSEDLVITNVAFVSNDKLIRSKLSLEEPLKDSKIMNGSTERAIVVDNVSCLDVRSNLVLDTKAIGLVFIESFLRLVIHLQDLLAGIVGTVNTDKGSFTSVSTESILPLDLKRNKGM